MRLLPLPALLACLCLSHAAGAQDDDAPHSGAAADAAKICAACLDDYLIVPAYQSRCGSSRGIPAEDVRKKLATEYAWRQGGKLERRTAPPDEEEVHAADALRSLDPGDYGWLHSVEVVKVLGARDLVVKDLWLADAKGAQADLRKFSEKLADGLERGQETVKKDYDARIAKLEKEKKSLAAWRNFGQNSGGTSTGNSGGSSSQGDAIAIKTEELGAQIKELNKQKSAALKDLSSNKTELQKAAKERGQARHDADQLQKKHRRDFAQTCRLTGFATAGLHPGDRFAGPKGDGLQVAVAWKDAADGPVLAAADLLQKPLDQAGFNALLAKRHVKMADFLRQASAAKQGKSGDDAARAVREAMAQWIRNADR